VKALGSSASVTAVDPVNGPFQDGGFAAGSAFKVSLLMSGLNHAEGSKSPRTPPPVKLIADCSLAPISMSGDLLRLAGRAVESLLYHSQPHQHSIQCDPHPQHRFHGPGV